MKNRDDKPTDNALSSAPGSEDAGQAFKDTVYTFLQTFCNYDIKTPLNAVLGYSNLLLKDDSLTEEQTGFSSTHQRSTRHLTSRWRRSAGVSPA